MNHKKLGVLNAQMLVVRNFIDEFYNKTLFKNGKATDSDLAPSVIKILYAFHDDTKEYPIGELGKNAQVKSSTITDMVDRLEQDGIVERVDYNLASGTLSRSAQDKPAGGGAPAAVYQVLANNVTALTFTYLDSNGTGTATAAQVRFVQILLSLNTTNVDPQNRQRRTITIQSLASVRN